MSVETCPPDNAKWTGDVRVERAGTAVGSTKKQGAALRRAASQQDVVLLWPPSPRASSPQV